MPEHQAESRAQSTVYFDGSMWVCVCERESEGHYQACRLVFDSEPKDYEVLSYLQNHYFTLLKWTGFCSCLFVSFLWQFVLLGFDNTLLLLPLVSGNADARVIVRCSTRIPSRMWPVATLPQCRTA